MTHEEAGKLELALRDLPGWAPTPEMHLYGPSQVPDLTDEATGWALLRQWDQIVATAPSVRWRLVYEQSARPPHWAVLDEYRCVMTTGGMAECCAWLLVAHLSQRVPS